MLVGRTDPDHTAPMLVAAQAKKGFLEKDLPPAAAEAPAPAQTPAPAEAPPAQEGDG